MHKMSNANDYDNLEPEPELVQAELVEVEPGAPWEWREVRVVQPPQRRWRLPILLFVATCLSTVLSQMDVERRLVGGAAATPSATPCP